MEKEKADYNNCRCRKCGTKLIHRRIIDGGKRVYICPKCLNIIIISSIKVDMDPETGLFSYEGKKNESAKIEEGIKSKSPL